MCLKSLRFTKQVVLLRATLPIADPIVAVMPSRRRQQGSTLMLALLVILLMSALIGALVEQQISSSTAVSYEVQGNRAFNAAQSGLQAGLTQLFPLNTTANCSAVSTNISFSGDGLAGCSASLSCSQLANPAQSNRPLYRLVSSGQCSAGELVTSRVVQMEAY